MISGECRVEPIGLAPGHQLALEGLRLRLDLRIVRGEGGDGVFRVEDGRVRTLPLGVPLAYRRAAVLSGLGALAVALVIGFTGAGPSEPARGAAVPVSTVTPAAGGARPLVAAPPAIEPHAGADGGVAPRVAPVRQSAPAPSVAAPSVAPSSAAPSSAALSSAAPSSAALSSAAPSSAALSSAALSSTPALITPSAPPAGSVASMPAVQRPALTPAAARAPGGDMLDLFSDPK